MVVVQYKCIDGQGRKVKTLEAANMPRWLIHPFNPWWRAFLYVTVAMAALTGEHFCPWNSCIA